MKYHFLLLFCALALGISSCASSNGASSWIIAGTRILESNKAVDFVEKPKKILVHFESKVSLTQAGVYDLERHLLPLIRARNVEVSAIKYQLASLDPAQDIQQGIDSFSPDVLLIISHLSTDSQFATTFFDVKMVTPDQKKVLWRGMLTTTLTINSSWGRSVAIVLLDRLERDGILLKPLNVVD